MHTAEGRIATDHANRYLTQLCRHANNMGHHLSSAQLLRSHHTGHAPPQVTHVEWSDAIGAIRFGDGQCILQASDNALLLRVEAITESTLCRLQEGIAHRLETFSYREHLTVRWLPSTYQPNGHREEMPSRIPAPSRQVTLQLRSRRARKLALAAVAAFAVAAHLGLLGATFAIAEWARWGATAILAVIVLKFIVTVGVHVAGGTFAIRQGKAFHADGKQRHTLTQWEGEMAGAAGENSYSKAPGLVLHRARLYDFTVWLMTLGRERAFREKILRLARLKPRRVRLGCRVRVGQPRHCGQAECGTDRHRQRDRRFARDDRASRKESCKSSRRGDLPAGSGAGITVSGGAVRRGLHNGHASSFVKVGTGKLRTGDAKSSETRRSRCRGGLRSASGTERFPSKVPPPRAGKA